MTALFVLILIAANVAGVWPRDELEAEVFVDVIRSIKRDIARSGRPMAGAR